MSIACAFLQKSWSLLQSDVLVGHPTGVIAALKHEAKTIPIVFVIVSDPVGGGFVESLPRPGGNITEGANGARFIHNENIRRHEKLLGEQAFRWLTTRAWGRHNAGIAGIACALILICRTAQDRRAVVAFECKVGSRRIGGS
jgi:hypothetical protein